MTHTKQFFRPNYSDIKINDKALADKDHKVILTKSEIASIYNDLQNGKYSGNIEDYIDQNARSQKKKGYF
jgi:hypothetical protein